MKSTLQVSSHLSMIKDNYEALNYKDVFHMATLGGAAGKDYRIKSKFYCTKILNLRLKKFFFSPCNG